jgi:hypothetical protein
MRVRDFIEWLKTQDQDAVVEVLVQERAPPYAPWGCCTETPFNPDEHVDYNDMSWSKEPRDRTLTLGVKD